MEEQVPFKAYMFLDEHSSPEVRRFGVDKLVVTSFTYIEAKLREIFPVLKGKKYTISWKDEEGDHITILSDEEVMIALGNMGQIVKLYVFCKQSNDKQNDDMKMYFSIPIYTGDKVIHPGVSCNACDSNVVGFRYKCVMCEDYDLCSNCEAAGKHPSHCLVRIPTPAMPKALTKAAIKRSRHLLRNLAVNSEDCKTKQEKCGDKQYYRGDCRRRRDGGHSWLHTFTTYMNEFANLAGDIDIKPPVNSEPQPQSSEPSTSAKEQHTNVNEEPNAGNKDKSSEKGPEQSTSGTRPANTPAGIDLDTILTPETKKILIDAQKRLVEMFLYHMDTPKEAKPNEEMGQGEPKGAKCPEGDSDSVQSEAVSGNTEEAEAPEAQLRDQSPDKVEGWTMINKEKDLLDMSPQTEANVHIEGESAHATVPVTNQYNLYPQLHAPTAVTNVMEPIQTPNVAPAAPLPQLHPQLIYLNPMNNTRAEPQPSPRVNSDRAQQNSSSPWGTMPVWPAHRMVPPHLVQFVPTAPAQAAPAQADPAQATPAQASPTQTAPAQATPAQAAPTQTAPAQATPAQAAQTQAAPAQATPAQAAPTQAAKRRMQPRSSATHQQESHRLNLRPHVAASLETMMGMGFTNDGGWLSQLLESHDGDIAAVVDLLTPVIHSHNF